MKTHVTVIPSDGIIAVDGEVLFLDGITSETFHALQWHDGAGHVEPGDGLPNEELSTDDYAGRVAPFVALWEEEKARLEEEANRPPTDEELAAQAVADSSIRAARSADRIFFIFVTSCMIWGRMGQAHKRNTAKLPMRRGKVRGCVLPK